MGNKHLVTTSSEVKLIVLSDGTHSVAELLHHDQCKPFAGWTAMGQGEARRAKGDPRNAPIGHAIALQRALQDAADKQKKAIKDAFGLDV